MAFYRVEWKPSAAKELKRLPRDVIPRVVDAVSGLATKPFPPGSVKLKGAQLSYRIRIGDYRVIYTVKSQLLIIGIVRVRHRRDVYSN